MERAIGDVIWIDFQGLGAEETTIIGAAEIALLGLLDEYLVSLGIIENDVNIEAGVITSEGSRFKATLTSSDVVEDDDSAELQIEFNIRQRTPTDPFDIIAVDMIEIEAIDFAVPIVSQTNDASIRAWITSKVNAVLSSGTTAAVALSSTTPMSFTVVLTHSEISGELKELPYTFAPDGIIAKSAAALVTTDGATINLDTGMLTVPANFTVAGHSINGRWRAGGIRGNDVSKLLNRGLILAITDKMDGRVPAADANTITFPAIAARPRMTLKLSVNYLQFADNTGATRGAWGFSTDRDSYSAPEAGTIEFARVIDRKIVPTVWGYYDRTVGVPVSDTIMNNRGKETVTRITYLFRIPAVVDGDTIIPPSAARRVNVTGAGRATNFRFNARNSAVAARDTAMFILNGGAAQQASRAVEAKSGDEFVFWTAATARRPASAQQTLVIP
jgi:hypothetical protein